MNNLPKKEEEIEHMTCPAFALLGLRDEGLSIEGNPTLLIDVFAVHNLGSCGRSLFSIFLNPE